MDSRACQTKVMIGNGCNSCNNSVLFLQPSFELIYDTPRENATDPEMAAPPQLSENKLSPALFLCTVSDFIFTVPNQYVQRSKY